MSDHQAQPERQASLGALFFGFPAQDADRGSDAQAPDAWQILFATEHADAGLLWGILCTCRAGRDFILQTAKKAKLRLDFSAEQPAGVWERRLSAVQQALASRGNKRTKLALTVGTDSLPAFTTAAVLLRDPVPSISKLRLRAAAVYAEDIQPADRIITGLLQCAAPSFTNLRSLSIKFALSTLPPPSQLPHLTELTVRLPYGCIPEPDNPIVQVPCKSIAPFLPQLQCLKLDGPNWPVDDGVVENDGYNKVFPWPTLFGPATTTTTLTHFSCDERLTGQLLGLLLAHAPALKHLGVWGVELGTDEYRQRVWEVETLSMLGNVYNESNIQLLPNTMGTLSINMGQDWWYHSNGLQAFMPALYERFPEWRISIGKELRLMPGDQLPAADQPAVLVATLQQLRGLQMQPASCGVAVHLADWDWTVAMAVAVIPAVQQLTQLGFTMHLDFTHTTRETFQALLQMAPHVKSAWLLRPELQSDHHLSTPWPSTDISFHCLDLMQLLKFPHPGTEGVREVRGMYLDLKDYIYQADVQRLSGVLQHIEWAPSEPKRSITVQLSNTQERYQGRALRSQLSVLPALQLAPIAQGTPEPYVRLWHWSLTGNVITALSQLPTWGGYVFFTSCTWPLSAPEYKSLAALIPTCYTHWCLGGVNEAQLDSICEGISEHRAGKGLPPVVVHVHWHHSIEPRRVGEHVLIEHWPW